MKSKLDTPEIRQFFDAILTLSDIEECADFFDDLCTVNELKTISQRLEVGIELMEGKTYQEVSAATGASTATISRVRRLLSDETDGLEKAAKRINRG